MSPDQPKRVVIVGAGHGGVSVVSLLRQQGFRGAVTLIGDESVSPYHRPPLSKRLFQKSFEQPLRPASFYRESGVELRTDTLVAAVDRERRLLRLANAEEIPYDVLVLATGAVPRPMPIPGIGLLGVHSLHTLKDAGGFAGRPRGDGSLAIIGGGWIGLEVAASARAAGLTVTVLEREDRVLARVASAALSEWLTAHHRERGVTIVTSAQVIAIDGDRDGSAASLRLTDGSTVAAEHVLVGVGALARDELARRAGLACDDGVIVDGQARTSDPHVFAVGDVTRRPIASSDKLVRLESIPSAIEQSRQVAAAILGAEQPPPEVPWFWSDQFKLKIQIAGLVSQATHETLRPNASSSRFSVFHTDGCRLLAVEAINSPADFATGKRLIREALDLDLERLADPDCSLEQMAREARSRLADSKGPDSLLAREADDPGAPEHAAVEQAPAKANEKGQARVTYIQADGSQRAVDVQVGLSMMEGSVRNNLPGILAECGGTCSCGTCHVHVAGEWLERLPEPYPEEEELLEFMEGRQPNSRLSCQIQLTEELDGIVVHVPDFKG
jgi:3-phenylpropionate/trans-cinnamate dioxygenase ferredoxin reductase subunit